MRGPRRLVFAALVFAATCATLEVLSRVAFQDELAEARGDVPLDPDGLAPPVLKGSPYLLWELSPGERYERDVFVHVNELGMRGDPVAIPKPAGVRRILATGDSSIYGYGVEDEDVFIQAAAAELGVEGLNAAVPGWSTWQTVNFLEMRGWSTEPDVVVIGNQWSDNNFDTFVDIDLLEEYAPHAGTARVRDALSSLAFYRLLRFRLVVERGDKAQARKVGWTVGGDTRAGPRRVEVNDYARNLERIAAGATERGAELVFVVLANTTDGSDAGRHAAWNLYRQVLRDTAARHGAPVVETPSLFAASGLGPDELFLDEMHPTAAGHALIADELVRALQPWADGGTAMGAPSGEPLAPYRDPFAEAHLKGD